MNYSITAGSIIVTTQARFLVISAMEQTEYKYITIGDGEWSLCKDTFSSPENLFLHLEKNNNITRVISEEDVLPSIPWGDEKEKEQLNPNNGPFLIMVIDKGHINYLSESSGEECYTDDINEAQLFLQYSEIPSLRKDEQVCFAPDYLPTRIVSIQGYSYIYNIETNANSMILDRLLSKLTQRDYSGDSILSALMDQGFSAVKVEKYCPNPSQVIPYTWE